MKKVFKLQDLECAHCAAKMEKAIAKLPGVQTVSINFMTEKLTLEADDAHWEKTLDEAQKAISKIEAACVLIR